MIYIYIYKLEHHLPLFVCISEMKLGNSYLLAYSDCFLYLYCYILNVSDDASSGLLQVFHVEIGTLHGTSNHIFNLIPGGRVC